MHNIQQHTIIGNDESMSPYRLCMLCNHVYHRFGWAEHSRRNCVAITHSGRGMTVAAAKKRWVISHDWEVQVCIESRLLWMIPSGMPMQSVRPLRSAFLVSEPFPVYLPLPWTLSSSTSLSMTPSFSFSADFCSFYAAFLQFFFIMHTQRKKLFDRMHLHLYVHQRATRQKRDRQRERVTQRCGPKRVALFWRTRSDTYPLTDRRGKLRFWREASSAGTIRRTEPLTVSCHFALSYVRGYFCSRLRELAFVLLH